MKKNKFALMVSALLLLNSVMVFGNNNSESISVTSQVNETQDALVYNFSDAMFDNLTFDKYEYLDDDFTVYSLPGSSKKMSYNNNKKTINGKVYSRYLSLGGNTVFNEYDHEMIEARDRCLGIWVNGESDVYITARSGSYDGEGHPDFKTRTLEIRGATPSFVDFSPIPETKVVHVNGGEILIGSEKNMGIYDITIVNTSNDSSYEINKSWTFDDSVYDTFTEELTQTQEVDDLTFLPGVRVASSRKILNGITYNRYLLLPRAGTQESSEVCFEVPKSEGETEIKIAAMSGGAQERTLQLIDKYGLVIGEMTVDSTLKEETFSYTGSTNDVYLRSADSGIRVYNISISNTN